MTLTGKTLDRAVIEAALDNSGLDYDHIHSSYSGRDRLDEPECFGLEFDNTRQLATFFLRLGEQGTQIDAMTADPTPSAVDDFENMIDNCREDSMGRGVIVYFPGWSLA